MNNNDKLYGFYRGKVLKHLSNGYCKIWIPSIYPDKWSTTDQADNLPSAEQASPLSFGANNGLGIFSYPNIGSIVWCFFQNGDQNLPVYFASTLGSKNASKEWDNARIMAGNGNNDAFMHIIDVKNTKIKINETGVLQITTKFGENSTEISMDSNGNIMLESTNQITLKSKNILLDATTQIDIKTKNIKTDASIQSVLTSPSIKLNSSAGHTTIISTNGTTIF